MTLASILNDQKVSKSIITLSGVVIISRTFPELSFLYYLLPLIFLLILFVGYHSIQKDKPLRNTLFLFSLFGLWCAVTSLWSEYPLVSFSRSGYFILISFGAVLGGYLWIERNSALLTFLIPANIIVLALSIFSLITNIPADSWTGGHGKGFMGFAGHQNILASAILFTTPAIMGQIRKIRKTEFKILNLFIWLSLFLNLTILILTYSRAAILSLILGGLVFLILTKKWNILIYISSTVFLVFFLIIFSSSLKEKVIELVKKDFPAIHSSREWLWEPSFRAALNGGLVGLGYGISDPDIIVPGTGSHYEGERYIREKGNSFLALIEEVGLIGLILFFLPLFYLFKTNNIRDTENKNQSPMIHIPFSIATASITAFIIHSQFEAWMVGVGSIQLPLFFFYAGSLIGSGRQFGVEVSNLL